MPTALRATARAVCGMTGFHRLDKGARPVLTRPAVGSAVIRRYDTGPARPTEVAPLNRNSG